MEVSKALVGIGLMCALFTSSSVAFIRRRTIQRLFLTLGAAFLLLTVLTHVCEGLDLFSFMRWGEPNSPGHYLDLSSALVGFVLLLAGVVGALGATLMRH